MTEKLQAIKQLGRQEAERIVSEGLTERKPGSLVHLLYGNTPSQQSTSIKFGKVGETLAKKMVDLAEGLKLLGCGCRDIGGGVKKDFDLLYTGSDTIFYRELKGNLELDTEKLPAMITKINKDILPYLTREYPGKTIDIGVLYWSVYERSDLGSHCAPHIRKCEEDEIKVDHMSDFMETINFEWEKDDFYSYFLSLGQLFNSQ